MVTTALEGRAKIDQLHKQLQTVPYNPDLRRLLKNCEGICTEVSKKEVLGRNSRQNYHTEKPLKDLNEAIDRLEKLILLAKLMA